MMTFEVYVATLMLPAWNVHAYGLATCRVQWLEDSAWYLQVFVVSGTLSSVCGSTVHCFEMR